MSNHTKFQHTHFDFLSFKREGRVVSPAYKIETLQEEEGGKGSEETISHQDILDCVISFKGHTVPWDQQLAFTCLITDHTDGESSLNCP